MFNNYGSAPYQADYNPTSQQHYPLTYEKQESNYHQHQHATYNNYGPPPGQQPERQSSPYGSPPPMQPYNHQTTYGQQHHDDAQQQPIIFRFSSTEQANTSLNLSVTDPWGRVVFTVSTPSKKKSMATDAERRVIATFDWDHSSPKMVYRGQTIKTKEFLRFEKKPTKHFILQHNGQPFSWNDVPDGQSILCHESTPGRPVAIFSRPDGHIQLQMFQDALSQGMLEPVLLSIFLLTCGKPFGPSGGLGSGTVAGIAVSAFMFS